VRRPTSVVTDQDVALLRSVGRERSVVAASRRVGISRDRAVYRLHRLARAFGGPIVASARGGRAHGGTQLTELGDRIVRGGFDSVELLDARPLAPLSASNRLSGIYHRAPFPEVVVGRVLHLRVAFAAEDGEPVSLLLDPEAVLVARERFASSARNVLAGRVVSVRPAGPDGRTVVVRVGSVRLRASVTPEPVRQLGLRPGAKVVLYVKATALRRVGPQGRGPTRGSLRS
jgi:molybdate transport repressor ModE-like protein/molybdopterin-binding protein